MRECNCNKSCCLAVIVIGSKLTRNIEHKIMYDSAHHNCNNLLRPLKDARKVVIKNYDWIKECPRAFKKGTEFERKFSRSSISLVPPIPGAPIDESVVRKRLIRTYASQRTTHQTLIDYPAVHSMFVLLYFFPNSNVCCSFMKAAFKTSYEIWKAIRHVTAHSWVDNQGESAIAGETKAGALLHYATPKPY